MFELVVSLHSVMSFPSLGALSSIGFDTVHYGQLSYLGRKTEYPRSQQIGEACAFLGADGLLVPSARHPASNNLIIFCEQGTQITKDVVGAHGVIEFG